MKRFHCHQRIFFDNTRCVRCGAALGFDARNLVLKPVDASVDRYCQNEPTYSVCNWLVPWEDENHFCLACRCNEVVPNLDVPGNLELWMRSRPPRPWASSGLRPRVCRAE